MEFKSFNKIEKFKPIQMTITEKLHGTNASVTIFTNEHGELDLRCGSRNRWIYPHDDNYGFANFVHANKEAFLNLGLGTHYGEWVGAGINSGYGLKDKQFVLFNQYLACKQLPPQTSIVPVLYTGPYSDDKIAEVKANLAKFGSVFAPDFMRPEGVVVQIGRDLHKIVFDVSETNWTKGSGVKIPRPEGVDFGYLMSEARLENVLSKDENLSKEYPRNIGEIVKLYINDLVTDGEISGDEDQIKSIRKGCTKQVFEFVKSYFN